MRLAKISENLQGELVAKATDGWTLDRLADWLKTEHGIEISHQAISKRLSQARTVRADIAKNVVRDVLGKSLQSDLECVETQRQTLVELLDVWQRTNHALYLKGLDRLHKLTDLKLHYSGADQPDDSLSELQAAADRVRLRLTRGE